MNAPARHAHKAPAVRKYLLGAVLALFIVVALWMALDLNMLHPDSINQPETTMKKLWWFSAPVVLLALFFGARWVIASQQAQARQVQFRLETKKAERVLAEGRAEQGRREYVLEIISMGVTLDKYRQGKLWDALQTGNAYTSIREKDPKKYPWGAIDKLQMMGGRGGDTLENGAGYTVMDWGVPVFNARPACHSVTCRDSPIAPDSGLVASADSSGMASHLFVVGPRRFEDRPDHILDDIFDFFDANPDIPYIIFNSDDGMDIRDMYKPDGAPDLVREGYYVPEMPDASTLFLLARRERVDAIRPFAFEDVDEAKGVEVLNRDGIGRRMFLTYTALTRTVPTPPKTEHNPFDIERQPLIDEWLPAAAKFAVRHDIRGTGPTSFIDGALNAKHRPPLDWKPTPWFPVPWNNLQLKEFDSMPTLGFVHRPVFVNMSDEHGKPLSRRDLRERALLDGWHTALKTLPEAQRAKGPARIIAATDHQKEQLLALHGVLSRYAHAGGPEIDTGRVDQFINTDHRLGNTGANTLFMQMAIGVMGSYRAGGASAAINLRDPKEASIVFITPPSDEKRKTQYHANGGDVFRHIHSHSIDPANYAPPGATAAATPAQP
jgi:hypothetical protein